MVLGQVDGLIREEKGPTYYRAHLAFGFGSPSPSGKDGKGAKKRGGDDSKPAHSSKRRKKAKFYDARESLPGVDEYGMLLPPCPSTRPAAAAAPAQRASAPAAAAPVQRASAPAAAPRSAAPAPRAAVPTTSAPAAKGTARAAGSTKKGAAAGADAGAASPANRSLTAAQAAAAAPVASAPRAAAQRPAPAVPAAAGPTESATRTTAASPVRPKSLAPSPAPAAVPAAAVSQSPVRRPALPPTQPSLASTALTAGGRTGTRKGEGGKRRRKKEKKTLSPKSKRAAVLRVVAQSAAGAAAQQAQQLQPSPAAAQVAAQPSAPAEAAAVAAAVTAPQQVPAGAAAPAQQQTAAVPAEFTRNLGKSWAKEDITTLARLATDSAFLQATIPDHPPGGELDWERIAKFFGRYSAGGKAVQAQYRLVLRTMKEARHEGRKGISYVDLVKTALLALPDRRGTVYEVQQYLKEKHSGSLDKYRDSGGALRWKKAVGEVLRSEKALFEQLGKTPTGKILWGLKAAPPS